MYKLSIILILFIVFSCILVSRSQKNLNIQFDRKKLDIGEIAYKSSEKYHFKFQNLGDTFVQIELVSLSCTCISAEWTKTKVFPNHTGHITISPNTGRLGWFKERAVIHYKDTDFKDTLYLSGNLVYK